MHPIKRAVSLLLAVMLLSFCGMFAFAAEAEPLTITAPTDCVQRKKTIPLTVNTQDAVTWRSSDTAVATVDASGVVTGVKPGTATISVSTADGRTANYKVYVMRAKMPWRSLLEKHQVLGYRYSYKGDYYYTDDKDCWQRYFGFNFAYDWIAPLMLFEYDYVRVFFTYQGQDWMVQMWKGQYGMVFYGSEVGLYTKPENEDAATKFAHYASADSADYLKIGTELRRQNLLTGEYDLEFERPYDDYWWCSGFVPGHLRDTTPCDELRTTTHITFKDAQMSKMFAEGLTECGFTEVRSQDAVQNDTFFRDGADVYLQWQNISQAANSHVVQTAVYGTVGFWGFMMLLGALFLMLISFGGLGLGLLLLI